MKLGIYLYLVILSGVIFEVVQAQEGGLVQPFLLKDYSLHVSSFVYYALETSKYIALAVIPYFFRLNHYLTVYICLEILDLIDYFLTANTEWFYFHDMPVTFNFVQVLVFTMLLTYDFVRNYIASHTIA